jgi:hypothetical protein
MSNPNMSGIPGVGAMTDTLDFVKKMWGGMNIPGMAMPSLSVNDINKQIADLKAVESWLTLNMNMLRGTIQALEVQSATISTLQSMGENMSAMMQRGPGGQTGNSAGSPFGGSSGFEPDFSFAPPTAEKPPAPKYEAPRAEPEPAPKGGNGAAADVTADAAAMAAQLANPAAWWNMLQDQFKQAVNTAVEPAPAAKTARPAAKPKTAAKGKAAPRKSKAAPKP